MSFALNSLLSLILFTSLIFHSQADDGYYQIQTPFPSTQANQNLQNTNPPNALNTWLITGWVYPANTWVKKPNCCYHMLEFLSETTPLNQFHSRICIPFDNNTATSIPYYVGFVPYGSQTNPTPVNSLQSQAYNPWNLINQNEWNYFYFAVDTTGTKITHGIQRGGMNTPGSFRFVEEITTGGFYTAPGTNLQFVVNKGIYNVTADSYTTINQWISDVKIWYNYYPGTAGFDFYKKSPFTGFYDITMWTAGPSYQLGVVSDLPNEGQLELVSGSSYTKSSRGTFIGNNTLQMSISSQDFRYYIYSRTDFTGLPASFGYYVKYNNLPSPVFHVYDSIGRTAYIYCDASSRLQLVSGQTFGINTRTTHQFANFWYVNRWIHIWVSFTNHRGLAYQNTTEVFFKITDVASGQQDTWTQNLPLSFHSSYNPYLTVGSAYDQNIGWIAYGGTMELKDMKFFNGDMLNPSPNSACVTQVYGEKMIYNNGSKCALCQTGYYQDVLDCYSSASSCPALVDIDLPLCTKCPLPSTQRGEYLNCTICGDFLWESWEGCDDGNTNSNDGCDRHCQIQAHSTCVHLNTGSNCTCEPKPIGAYMSTDWDTISVIYELPVLKTPTTTNLTTMCYQLYTNANILGYKPTCNHTDTNITIVLGPGATVINANQLQFVSGTIYYSDCTITNKFYQSVAVTADMSYTPVVKTEGPEYTLICTPFKLNVTYIGKTANRPYSYKWVVGAVPTQDSSHLAAIQANLNNQLNNINVTVPEGILNLNVTYTFSFQVTNFLSNVGQSSVQVRTYLVPNITFNMPGMNNLFRWDRISLYLTVNPYYCGTIPYNTNAIRFNWTQNENDTGIVDINKCLNPENTGLSFQAFQLNSSYKYNFKVRAIFVDDAQTPPAELSYSEIFINAPIYVGTSDLVAFIVGGNKQVSLDSVLTMDGSQSNDPDDPTNSGLRFGWSCQFLDTRACTDSLGRPLSLPTKPVIEFGSRTLIVGSTYVFFLTIQKDNRFKTATARIKIIASSAPGVLLNLPPKLVGQKIDPTQNFTLIATVFSKKPSTITYDWQFQNDQSGVMSSVTIPANLLLGTQSTQMKVLQGALTSGVNYQVTLTVTDQYGSASATLTIPINSPPVNGMLDVYPLSGLGFTTPFLMDASGWVDLDLPMQYKFAFWRETADIGNMDKLIDASQWSYLSKVVKKLENPESHDNYIHMYSVAMDIYGAVSVSQQGINIYVTPLIFNNIKVVKMFHDEIFQSVVNDNSNEVLESANLVTGALRIYENHRRLRNLQADPDALATEQSIASDVINRIGVTKGINTQQVFESSTRILSSLTSKSDRLTTNSANGVLDFMSTQFSQRKSSGDGVSSSGTNDVASILDSVVESQTVVNPSGRRVLTADGVQTFDKLGTTVNHFFDSIATTQLTGDSTKIQKTNFDLQAKTTVATSISGMQLSSPSGPSITCPQLNMTSTGKVTPPVNLNFINWNTNIYNVSDSLPLSTSIVGLKFKDSSSSAEIPMKNLNNSFTIEMPLLHYTPADNVKTFSCIYFQPDTKTWGADGCKYSGIKQKSDGSHVATCLCNHLTDFSLSDQFGSLIGDSGFQYIGNASDAFASGKLGSLKILYVLIILLLTKLAFMGYGHFADKHSKTVAKTLAARGEVMQIGIKTKNREFVREEANKIDDFSLDDATFQEQEDKKLKIRSRIPKQEIAKIGPGSPLKSGGSTKVIDLNKGSSGSLASTRANEKEKLIDQGIPLASSRRNRDYDTRSTSRLYKVAPEQINSTRSGKTSSVKQEAKAPGFGSAYLHALKKSHNFLSIFQKYNPNMTRALRFFLYFIRFYGMLAISSIFFTATHSGEFNIFNVIVIMIMTFFMLGFVLLILSKLLVNDLSHKKKLPKHVQVEETRKAKIRKVIGVFFGLAYCAGCIFMTLLVALSIETKIADAIFYTFLVQIAHDIFVNQPIKVLINMILLQVLSKYACKGCRKTLMKIIDANVATAFV